MAEPKKPPDEHEETAFQRFLRLAQRVVTAPKRDAGKRQAKEQRP